MPTEPNKDSNARIGTIDTAATGSGLRRSGIDILGAIPWGTHFCQFYETPEDLIDVLVPYFREGLQQNEFCMWGTSEPLQAEDAKWALRQALPDLEDHLRQGQIEILDYRQWYTASGKFDTDRVLAGWVEKERCALERGCEGLRLSGNTFWLEKSDWDAFASYEAAVDGLIKRHRMIALCTYAVGRCNAREVIEVVNNHQFALIRRSGRWEMMESRQRRRAEEALRESEKRLQEQARCLEQRVKERTAELRAANEALQREIAERIRSEEATARLAAIVESSEDAITGKTLEGVITSWNQAAVRMYGYAAVEILGKSTEILTPPDRPTEIPRILERIRQGQHVEHHETVRVRKDGQCIAVSLTVSPIKDQSGQVIGAATIARDITQRKRLEEELRTASSYARSLIEASLDPLVTISPLGKITDVNQATEQATGVSRQELIGSDFSRFFTEPQKANEGYQMVISQGYVRDYPLTMRHVSGQTMDVLYNATIYRNEIGQVQGVFAAARDITQRKRMEEELRKASRHARSLIEASLDPLVTISPNGQITDVNKATELATGVEQEMLIGSDFSQYFTEPAKASTGYHKVLTEGRVNDYPLTIRHTSGRTTDVLYNATVYRNEAGEVQGVFAAARDITERKATERRQSVTNALLELFARKNSRKEYLDSVVEVIRDWSGCQCVGIRLADAEGRLAYESQVGFDDDFCQLGNDLSLKRDACFCIRAVTQQPLDGDRPVRTPGGSFRCDDASAFMEKLLPPERNEYRNNCVQAGFASLAVIPVRYRDQTLGVVHLADRRKAVASPATVEFIEAMSPLIGEAIHRFNAEAELRTYRERLEELVAKRTEELARSNQDLEQFAYVASHDLQEPLRMVAGYLQLLSQRYQGQLDEKADKYIAYAVDGAERMSTLIRDLLAFSRVNTRGDELQTVDSHEAFESALRNLGSAIRESGAVVRHDPLPAVCADPTQLAQVFQNLIGNAIKFRSPDRPPEVHVTAEERKGEWLFRVGDNGIGFDQQYEDKVFLIFQRLQGRGHYPGTGIGLAICKRIVERHGGRIWATSEPGQGSTFFFTIPK